MLLNIFYIRRPKMTQPAAVSDLCGLFASLDTTTKLR
jgi:hypothetical protein